MIPQGASMYAGRYCTLSCSAFPPPRCGIGLLPSIHFARPSSTIWQYTSFTIRSVMFKFSAVETRVSMAGSLLKTGIILNCSSSSLCAEPTGSPLAILRKDSTVCWPPMMYQWTFFPWYHGISFQSSRIFSSIAAMLSITASILLFSGPGFLFNRSAYISGFFRIEPNPLYVVYT
jgi:hypothetical protein